MAETLEILVRFRTDLAKRDAADIAAITRQMASDLAASGAAAAKAFEKDMGKAAQGVRDTTEESTEDMEALVVALMHKVDELEAALAEATDKMKDDFDSAARGGRGLIKSLVDVKAGAESLAELTGQIGELGEMGARNRDLSDSFDQLAERAGFTGDALVAAMQKASKGTVTSQSVMRASNMVLGAQFKTTTEDMAKMMEFARLKSKQFGLTTEAAFERMSFGAVKAEVEFLDELGITLKLNDALNMYAESLGKSASELKSTERSQAIWNALLLQADQQLADFPGGVNKASDSYEALDVALQEVTLQMAELVDKSGIGPFMSQFTKLSTAAAPAVTTLAMSQHLATSASVALNASLGLQGIGLVAYTKAVYAAAGAQGVLKNAMMSTAATAGLVIGALVAAGLAIKTAHNTFVVEMEKGQKKVGDAWRENVAGLEEIAKSERGAAGVAEDYIKTRQKVSDQLHQDGGLLKDIAAAQVRQHVNESELVNKQEEQVAQLLILNSKSYPDYIANIEQVNAAQTKHAEQMMQVNEALFNYERALAGTDEALKAEIASIEQLIQVNDAMFGSIRKAMLMRAQAETNRRADEKAAQEREERKIERQDVLAIAETAYAKAVEQGGASTQEMADKMDALNIGLGKTTENAVQARKDLELMAGAAARGVITYDELKDAVEKATAGELALDEATRKLYESTSKQLLPETEALSMAMKSYQETMRQIGTDANTAKASTNALAIAFGQTTKEEIAAKEAAEYYARAAAVGVMTEIEAAKAIKEVASGMRTLTQTERDVIDGRQRLIEETRNLADLRKEEIALAIEEATIKRQFAQDLRKVEIEAAKATRDAHLEAVQARVDAYSQMQQSLAAAAKEHTRNIENIELSHRRALERIDRNYMRTVKGAAIERDALAILEARERRDQERQDENQNYQDALRNETQVYQDQLAQVKDSYQQRLQEIQESLNEELRREAEANQERLTMLNNAKMQELAELRRANQELEAEQMRHISQMNAINASGRWGGGGGAGGPQGQTHYMQRGGSGVVRGPATFKVEPGVTEAYWFSGAMSQRTQTATGGAMQPAGSHSVTVGGTVGVDLSGVSETVLGRLVPVLSEAVTEAVVGELTTAFAEATTL